MTPALRAERVVKTFRDGERETRVLCGVDLQIAPGEFVALQGPSGSGKSTLLAILGTLLRPTSGTVEVAGRPIAELRSAELAAFRNRNLGFVFQLHHLLPEFSAVENVAFPALAAHRREVEQDLERAARLLERVGLAGRVHYLAARLSGGEKQRVAVARAVMMRPGLVLADEPTGSLDTQATAEVLELLRSVGRAEGTAFLLATHDPEVAGICDRVVHLLDGRIVEPAAP